MPSIGGSTCSSPTSPEHIGHPPVPSSKKAPQSGQTFSSFSSVSVPKSPTLIFLSTERAAPQTSHTRASLVRKAPHAGQRNMASAMLALLPTPSVVSGLRSGRSFSLYPHVKHVMSEGLVKSPHCGQTDIESGSSLTISSRLARESSSFLLSMSAVTTSVGEPQFSQSLVAESTSAPQTGQIVLSFSLKPLTATSRFL